MREGEVRHTQPLGPGVALRCFRETSPPAWASGSTRRAGSSSEALGGATESKGDHCGQRTKLAKALAAVSRRGEEKRTERTLAGPERGSVAPRL
jgi:hypothetical protein